MTPRLTGPGVVLEPLCVEHAMELLPAADDARIWAYLPHPPPEDEAGLLDWIAMRLDAKRADDHIFLVRDATGAAAGSTTVFDHAPEHKRCEVGYTWYGTQWWGTGLNDACKSALLGWLFDDLGLRRVQFKHDARNERSAAALAKLGATKEGVLRRHDTWWDGHIGDAPVWSILDHEWPTVRDALDVRLSDRTALGQQP